ncbi:MAG TPA: TonB-dependent receptor [Vicinamibacterales bacterium]|nr:TonB-dependent receptor [Vicinamibacterales bacterium]
MRSVPKVCAVLLAFVFTCILTFSANAIAQVLEATLYGVVQDSSGAILPGVTVTVTHQGTTLTRDTVSDARGEFALPALPAGAYTIRIELSGFKTYENRALRLSAGQTVRQTFGLEVGGLAETVTVAESAPLIETATTAQVQSLGEEVREIPVSRRNLQNVVLLGSGISSSDSSVAGGRAFRVNGVGDGGHAITVDGSSAQTNPENRGFGNYGGQNQIEILSVESVAEVQVAKGVLPAEYGGSIGAQVNMITRSGTNQFHGSLLENFQSDAFATRDPFLPATSAKPEITFNQFGGSLGGPILRNRVLFFGTYEGYREESGMTVQGNVATQATRNRMLAALPYPETRLMLDNMPQPNAPINDVIGLYTDAKTLVRRDNTFLGKVDFEAGAGRLSVTASRMQPFASVPRIQINNNQEYTNGSKRLSTNYVLTRNSWVSESRFGWNRNTLDRLDAFWVAESPSRGPQEDLYNVRKRISTFNVSGLFNSGETEILTLTYDAYNVDQKFTRLSGAHTMKFGFRWARESGFKSNLQTNRFTFASLDDLLANKASNFLLAMGQPPHRAWMDQFGGFIQDDWRVNGKFVLNLGMRYDYYPGFGYKSTDSNDPAEVNNLNDPSDIRKMDFGAPRPLDAPVDGDKVNIAPRAGFAWTIDRSGATVVRGGVGVFTAGHLMALFQNSVARPFTPIRLNWNRTEQEARGISWPNTYPEDAEKIALRDSAGKKSLYYLFETNMKSPETVQVTFDVQRQIGRHVAVSAGYVHTNGRNLPMLLNFADAYDRVTGARPNPAVLPGGYYVTSGQTMKYNAFEGNANLRRFRGLDLAVHYTLSKGWSQQGANLVSNFNGSIGGDTYRYTQDFFDPFLDADYSPLAGEVRHRVTSTVVYELPWLVERKDVVGGVLGGWQLASVLNFRTGEPLRITQTSGIANSRPDYNGRNQIFDDWRDTLQYLDRNAYTLVPTSPTTRATIRPGSQNASQVLGPGRRRVDLTIAKSFTLPGHAQLQVRFESFNVFNWRQYNNPVTDVLAPNFGQITSVAATRTGQIGLRLTF